MKAIGKLSIYTIDTAHVTEIMLLIESTGHLRKARMVLSVMNRIFAYALAHRVAITESTLLAKLIKDIDNAPSGSYCTKIDS